jgi:hypothetical protein
VPETDLVRHLVFAASYEGVKMIDTPLRSEKKRERDREGEREREILPPHYSEISDIKRSLLNKRPSPVSIIHTSILSHSDVRFTVINKYNNCMGRRSQ